MTTLAVMQPYFFPYIGYWQLLHAVDRFVVFDDVAFIKRGWINRNRLLINGQAAYITAPLQHASQNKRICDIQLDPTDGWRAKLLRSVEYAYRNAPFFVEIFPVIEELVRHGSVNLADYLTHQLQTLSSLLGIRAEFISSRQLHGDSALRGQVRILEICRREQATTYINLPGGMALYDSNMFLQSGVDLRFIVMQPLTYKQRTPGFIPSLSIIDPLMEIGLQGVSQHLDKHQLIHGVDDNMAKPGPTTS